MYVRMYLVYKILDRQVPSNVPDDEGKQLPCRSLKNQAINVGGKIL